MHPCVSARWPNARVGAWTAGSESSSRSQGGGPETLDEVLRTLRASLFSWAKWESRWWRLPRKAGMRTGGARHVESIQKAPATEQAIKTRGPVITPSTLVFNLIFNSCYSFVRWHWWLYVFSVPTCCICKGVAGFPGAVRLRRGDSGTLTPGETLRRALWDGWAKEGRSRDWGGLFFGVAWPLAPLSVTNPSGPPILKFCPGSSNRMQTYREKGSMRIRVWERGAFVLLKVGSYRPTFLCVLLFSFKTPQLRGLVSLSVHGAWVEDPSLQQVFTFPLPGTQGTTNPSPLYFAHYCILHKYIYLYIIHIDIIMPTL